MTDLVILAGTRPEIIKLAPLLKALESSELKTRFVLSGQHTDLAEDVLDSLDLEFDLKLDGIKKSSLHSLRASLALSIGDFLEKSNARAVLALGDTATVLETSLAADTTEKLFFHVEAGLRTSDKRTPFPEERFRRRISSGADFHFAPSNKAAENLYAEGVDRDSVYVVGSTFLEAFEKVRNIGKSADFFLSDNAQGKWDFVVHGRIREDINNLEQEPSIPVKTVLFTSHRRENIPSGLSAICDLAVRLTQKSSPDFNDMELPHFAIWPVHPNPAVNLVVRPKLKYKHRVKLTRSLKYHEFAWLLERVDAVVTDSAGVMEEASIIGVPTVVARTETERPELFYPGGNLLLAQPEIEDLSEKLAIALKMDKRTIGQGKHVYDFGSASAKIVAVLEHHLLDHGASGK